MVAFQHKMTSSHVVAAAANRLDNRVSGGSFLSDDEFVVIRLGGSASLTKGGNTYHSLTGIYIEIAWIWSCRIWNIPILVSE